MKLSEVVKQIKDRKKAGEKVGLITGCFDILHSGHCELFELAKEHVDILIIGVDCDATVKMNKAGRPINTLSSRISTLERNDSVDYVFPIEQVFKFGTKASQKCHEKIWNLLDPDYVITCSNRDELAKFKEKELKKFSYKFLNIVCDNDISTTKITSSNRPDLQS